MRSDLLSVTSRAPTSSRAALRGGGVREGRLEDGCLTVTPSSPDCLAFEGTVAFSRMWTGGDTLLVVYAVLGAAFVLLASAVV